MRFFMLVRTLVLWALLAGAAVFFGHGTYELWYGGAGGAGSEGVPVAAAPPGRRPPVPRVPRGPPYRRPAPVSAYDVVPQQDLFSSDRSEGVLETPEAPLLAAPARPMDSRFALFGVLVEGSQRRALVANLDRRAPGDPDQVWVEVGDVLGNLTVVEIGAAQIVVSDGSSAHVVQLSERSSSKRPGVARPVRAGEKVQRIEVGRPGEKAIRPQEAAGTPAGAPQQ